MKWGISDMQQGREFQKKKLVTKKTIPDERACLIGHKVLDPTVLALVGRLDCLAQPRWGDQG
jgi:hypothetical protein